MSKEEAAAASASGEEGSEAESPEESKKSKKRTARKEKGDKKKKVKKDPGPKRPTSSFMYFSNEKRPELKAKVCLFPFPSWDCCATEPTQ